MTLEVTGQDCSDHDGNQRDDKVLIGGAIFFHLFTLGSEDRSFSKYRKDSQNYAGPQSSAEGDGRRAREQSGQGAAGEGRGGGASRL